MKNVKLGRRKWLIFIIIGLAGQFARSIENMYLNTYLTYLNFNAADGQGFDYSLYIAITTAASAITATLTTLFMGALSDKVNKRKIFIVIGYILWGISTASFGLFNVVSANELIPISMSVSMAGIMIIIMDCVMTFFGSSANDAAFNSYVTKNTDDSNRGKVEGILSILSLVSLLIIFGGLNSLTTEANGNRWDLFFYIIGAIVFIVGIISAFLIPRENDIENVAKRTYLGSLTNGFLPSVIKANKKLYLMFLIYFIYSVSLQIYFPYMMVYIQYTCKINNEGSGLFTPFVIVMLVSLLLGSIAGAIIGFLGDKFGKEKMIIPLLVGLTIGLVMMFSVPYINAGTDNDTGRIIYCSISGLIMIFGYAGLPTIINALIRQYIPKGEEGSFMGIRMLFVVALPMCIGPFVGDAINKAGGLTYTDPTTSITDIAPSNRGYIAGALVLFLVLVPLYFYMKEKRKSEATEK